MEPANGATVTSQVTVELVAEGFEIDTNHIHLGNGQSQTSLTPAPGPHTICLQAGDGLHRALALTSTFSLDVVAS